MFSGKQGQLCGLGLSKCQQYSRTTQNKNTMYLPLVRAFAICHLWQWLSLSAQKSRESWEVHWARAVHGCSIPQLEYLHHLTSMCMIPAKRLRFYIDYIDCIDIVWRLSKHPLLKFKPLFTHFWDIQRLRSGCDWIRTGHPIRKDSCFDGPDRQSDWADKANKTAW